MSSLESSRRGFLKGVALSAVPPGVDPSAFSAQGPTPAHPLDPLTSREIEAVSRLLQTTGKVDRSTRFWSIELLDPPKAGAPSRKALAVAYHLDTGATRAHVVDLASERVVESRDVQEGRAGLFPEEYERAITLALNSREVARALARRNITNLSSVVMEAWSPGPLAMGDAPSASNGRIVRLVPYLNSGAANAFARPIEGLVVTVDLRRRDAQGNAGAVVHVLDTGPVPLAPQSRAPRAGGGAGAGAGAARGQGRQIAWGPWQFRLALLDREGPVLYDVQVRDGARLRPLLYRASISEIVTLYGDPGRAWAWRNPFDEGYYGLGRTSSRMRAGAEVPANAQLLDAVIADEFGKPKVLRDRIGVYERDAGILWTHAETWEGPTATRRATELVVQSISTLGNYDLVFNWIFAEDGRLTFRWDLTGVMLAKGVRETRCAACELPPDPAGRVPVGEAAYGMQVAPNLVGVYHQHYLNMRLDFDIDGTKNAVRELEAVPMPPGPDNPLGNGVMVKETALLTEKAARRAAAPGRYWKVINPERPGPLGHFPGYLLHPHGAAIAPPLVPANATGELVGWLQHAFWATRRRPGETYASGYYVDTEKPEGLREWSERDDRIEGEDLVVWHTLGSTHIPHAEEWPIMPVSHMGFTLVPHNFFENNPAFG